MTLTCSISISGKVQGVFFRQMAKEKADRIGLTGTVENREDRVFIIATGTQEQIDELAAWCREGPPRAVVEKVEVSKLALQPFSGFRILRW